MSDLMTRFKEQELRLLICTIQNFDGKIGAGVSTRLSPHFAALSEPPTTFSSNLKVGQVDWDKNARDAGYKDSTNARVMWSRLAKKIAETSFESSSATSNPSAKTTNKRKARDAVGDDEGAAGASTKGNKKRKTTGA